MNMSNYILLSLILIIWCIIHSLLISNKFISFIQITLGTKFRFYRIFYNTFSLITFFPIILYSEFNKGEYIFTWTGNSRIIQGAMLAISLFLFIAGTKHYDGLVFLGIRQIKSFSNQKALTESGDLDTNGILSVIRHPWYSASILLLWSRNIDINSCLVNVILTSYLIIGSFFEENKLSVKFGEKYRSYQQNVSMLFPYKWFKSKIFR